jgi:hypothetical protein
LQRSAALLAEYAERPPGPPPRAALRRAPAAQPAPDEGALDPALQLDPSTAPADHVTELFAKQNAVLKKLFFDMRLLRRQVAHIAHAIEHPGAPLVNETTTPAVASARPDVTVVIALHNYGRFVSRALASVLASQDVALETIVVDDASIDDSANVVRAFMAEHPEAPITLFEQRVNTGVQRARNLAFARARAPLAFVLDADNEVFPRGIAKLRDALEADRGAAFAYGLIERFGESGSLDLLGTQGWNSRLLAQGNYIDAMALVRVDAWRQVGGYVSDPLFELGAEDYDLWLSFATAGMHGAHVREIIGRYRLHGVSSLSITTLDAHGLMAMLRQRHAAFFAQVESEARA